MNRTEVLQAQACGDQSGKLQKRRNEQLSQNNEVIHHSLSEFWAKGGLREKNFSPLIHTICVLEPGEYYTDMP